ncbi:MAG: sulfatase-like hydrolase/transferase [Chloroflexota bacterium]
MTMKQNYSRRELLKLMMLAGMTQTAPRFFDTLNPGQGSTNEQNVLVVVFDALSARNMNLYGYRRNTMPLLSKLAEKAIVFHDHYAGGGYTTPATASILTGTLPWTHRAFKPHETVIPEYEQRNIFSEFGKQKYFRVGYTHNILADVFIKQFRGTMEQRIPRQDLYLNDYWISDLFDEDFDNAFLAMFRAIEDNKDGITSALYLPRLYDEFFSRQRQASEQAYADTFPNGLPSVQGNY